MRSLIHCVILIDFNQIWPTPTHTPLALYSRFHQSVCYWLLYLQNTTRVEHLDLSRNRFGERAGLELGPAISENSSIKYLDLSWNSIRKKGAVAVAQGIKVTVRSYCCLSVHNQTRIVAVTVWLLFCSGFDALHYDKWRLKCQSSCYRCCMSKQIQHIALKRCVLCVDECAHVASQPGLERLLCGRRQGAGRCAQTEQLARGHRHIVRHA